MTTRPDRQIFVVGAGGLAHPLLLELLRLWPTSISASILVLDEDNIELSNLNRQVLFDENDLNAPKASTLVKKLRDDFLDKNVSLAAHPNRLTPENADSLLKQADLVFDCCDHIPSKFLINDYCVENSIPFCYAGAVEERGMCVAVPGGPEKPSCLRCIFGSNAELLLRQQTETCQTAGILGPVVGLIGTLEAQLGLKLLGLLDGLPVQESLFFRFSGKTFQWSQAVIHPSSDCPLRRLSASVETHQHPSQSPEDHQ